MRYNILIMSYKRRWTLTLRHQWILMWDGGSMQMGVYQNMYLHSVCYKVKGFVDFLVINSFHNVQQYNPLFILGESTLCFGRIHSLFWEKPIFFVQWHFPTINPFSNW